MELRKGLIRIGQRRLELKHVLIDGVQFPVCSLGIRASTLHPKFQKFKNRFLKILKCVRMSYIQIFKETKKNLYEKNLINCRQPASNNFLNSKLKIKSKKK